MLLKIYFWYFEFGGTTRVGYWSERDLIKSLSERSPKDMLPFFLGVFGGGLLFIANKFAAKEATQLFITSTILRLIASLFVSITVAMVVFDTTRILTVLAWPIVIFILSSNNGYFRQQVTIPLALVMSIAISPNHYWNGKYYQGPLNNFAYIEAQNLFEKLVNR